MGSAYSALKLPATNTPAYAAAMASCNQASSNDPILLNTSYRLRSSKDNCELNFVNEKVYVQSSETPVGVNSNAAGPPLSGVAVRYNTPYIVQDTSNAALTTLHSLWVNLLPASQGLPVSGSTGMSSTLESQLHGVTGDFVFTIHQYPHDDGTVKNVKSGDQFQFKVNGSLLQWTNSVLNGKFVFLLQTLGHKPAIFTTNVTPQLIHFPVSQTTNSSLGLLLSPTHGFLMTKGTSPTVTLQLENFQQRRFIRFRSAMSPSDNSQRAIACGEPVYIVPVSGSNSTNYNLGIGLDQSSGRWTILANQQRYPFFIDVNPSSGQRSTNSFTLKTSFTSSVGQKPPFYVHKNDSHLYSTSSGSVLLTIDNLATPQKHQLYATLANAAQQCNTAVVSNVTGNNGTVSCDTYCNMKSQSLFKQVGASCQWSGGAAAVGARDAKTGMPVGLNTATQKPLVCDCARVENRAWH